MFKKLLLALLVLGVSAPAFAKDIINGAGASFPYPVYSSWAYLYTKDTGKKINYQSIGSGGGIKQIIAGTVDFGASDEPMNKADIEKNKLYQFPAITGGIVVIVNIDNNKHNKLVLNSDLLSNIFLGNIKKWNDPAITKLNPTLKLPDAPITVIRRSDSSGTTAIFTKYLNDTNKVWAKEIGFGKSVNWKTGIGAKGNDGVSNLVKQTKNSISYTEFSYAIHSKNNYTLLQNYKGQVLEPNVDTFSKAVAGANWKKEPNYAISLTNVQQDNAWPIVAASFILLKKDNKEVNAEIKKFFEYAFNKGDDAAKGLNYIPLSTELKTEILNNIK